MYQLRSYQKQAVQAAMNFLKGKNKHNAMEVLPTGSGKSLVIANIAKELNGSVIIFQPTKEILEQNFAKYISYGFPATIYSASMRQKRLSNTTFATIGSVINKKELFKEFDYFIIDECHLVNPKGGRYNEFIQNLEKAKGLGLTATPYRLTTDGFGGSILKFLTRTRPRIFKELIYYVQNGELFKNGYLTKLQYNSVEGFERNRIVLNTTGADFNERSERHYYNKIGFSSHLLKVLSQLTEERKNILVFTHFIEESKYLVNHIPNAAMVTGETPKRERERIIDGFRSGKIKVVCNVGVLTTGFDYPELETIVIGRPTMSLALYYQMVGRGLRPHPEKQFTQVVDLCGNIDLFGPVESLQINNGGNGKWFVSNKGRQLTNVYYGER